MIGTALNSAYERFLRTLDTNLFAGKSMSKAEDGGAKITEIPDEPPGRPFASFLPEITKAAHSILNCYPNDYVKVCWCIVNKNTIYIHVQRI